MVNTGKKSCICSFIFGRALTSKLCTARENNRTNFILCRCLNIQKYQSKDGTHLQNAAFAHCLSALCRRVFIFGFNLSWSFDGDFCFCFVGLGPLGFCCCYCCVVFNFFFNLSFLPWKKRRGEKRQKFQAAKFSLLYRFWIGFKNLVRAEELCVTWCYSF